MLQKIRKLLDDRFEKQCHRIWATYQCAKITQGALEELRYNMHMSNASEYAHEVIDNLLDDATGVMEDAEERFYKIRHQLPIKNRCWL